MKKSIVLLLASILMLFSCGKEDENSLTAPTTDGKGTLSFLLDGEVWRPKTEFYIPVTPASHGMEISVIQYDTNNGNKANELILFHIGARNIDKNNYFSIEIDSVLFEGKYSIKEALFSKGFNQNYNIVESLSNSNFVNITKIHRDYKSHVEGEDNWGYYTMGSYISGKFEMTLKNKNGDSVVITDGRFDLMKQAYYNY
ncbi:MAG: hypothetical protein RO257_08925 [Candidatus Kapabacteria bacterium]|jgi:hypothetical protein|nr:hypothetical protein [Candidatus Kapabacteria bacterium]